MDHNIVRLNVTVDVSQGVEIFYATEQATTFSNSLHYHRADLLVSEKLVCLFQVINQGASIEVFAN